MADNIDEGKIDGLSLTDIDSQRTSEERSRDGKSGEILYSLDYHKQDGKKIVEGKVTEVGQLDVSGPIDLQSLAKEGYTHYGIFRLKDRSTTTIIQNKDGNTFKVFSLGRNNAKVSYPVTIAECDDS